MQYTDFHIHTKYTEGNGITEISPLIEQAKNFGMSILTITDSGSIAGLKRFNSECRSNGIKPQFACGFYYAPLGLERDTTHHLVLVARSAEGVENLIKLDNFSRTTGLGKKNRIDLEMLKRYSSGLIALSGGLGGIFDKPWLQGNRELAEKNISDIMGIFRENFYLELQDNELENNRTMNKIISELGERVGVETIITGGSFYLHRSDAEKCNVVRDSNGNRPLSGTGYYFKSSNDLLTLIEEYPKAYQNSCTLSSSIDDINLEKVEPLEE